MAFSSRALRAIPLSLRAAAFASAAPQLFRALSSCTSPPPGSPPRPAPPAAAGARGDPDRFIGLTGAAIIHELLREHGVEIVFGYPGGAILPVYDAIVSLAL